VLSGPRLGRDRLMDRRPPSHQKIIIIIIIINDPVRASRARSGHLPGLMRSPTSPSAASQKHRRGCTMVG
jgi:hypothetical protein